MTDEGCLVSHTHWTPLTHSSCLGVFAELHFSICKKPHLQYFYKFGDASCATTSTFHCRLRADSPSPQEFHPAGRAGTRPPVPPSARGGPAGCCSAGQRRPPGPQAARAGSGGGAELRLALMRMRNGAARAVSQGTARPRPIVPREPLRPLWPGAVAPSSGLSAPHGEDGGAAPCRVDKELGERGQERVVSAGSWRGKAMGRRRPPACGRERGPGPQPPREAGGGAARRWERAGRTSLGAASLLLRLRDEALVGQRAQAAFLSISASFVGC